MGAIPPVTATSLACRIIPQLADLASLKANADHREAREEVTGAAGDALSVVASRRAAERGLYKPKGECRQPSSLRRGDDSVLTGSPFTPEATKKMRTLLGTICFVVGLAVTAAAQLQPVPSASCEKQVYLCHACPSGRASATFEAGGCIYGSLAACRASILQSCKSAPPADDALDVIGGKLTDKQVVELIDTCRNVPHGATPYTGARAVPGSKKARQCDAFETTYVACAVSFQGFDAKAIEDREACLQNTYTGP
jgi:hypothetical protein